MGAAPQLETTQDLLAKPPKFDEELIREANKSDRVGTLTHRIMMLVAYKSYSQAVQELNDYINERSKELAALYLGAHKYILRCQTLISAVEKKRSIPGLDHQTANKQQEVFELIKEYFKELKTQLKGIENVEHALLVEDVRSTVWVVRVFTYSLFAVFAAGFIIDISTGSYDTIVTVSHDYFIDFCDWVLGLFF